ncbi:hypothetical protein [Plebeiibacterium sediminum]|uniref:Uncharacterized protein n=1 Tax=Plebeiibacterium sediminum TaxID=2992112 RepID=A0AAE3M221_9BACT|nr:hypothetical protein [Plebeiobacterium sediminum]MCW3785375.1 hypothetical protein [Plebeiobacterium sediminum]
MKNERIANVANYLAAAVALYMGTLYLTANSFMSYHSEAVSHPWSEVESSFQCLILALMRVVAGGFIATAIVIAVLQKKFTSDRKLWISSLILIQGLIVTLTSTYATLIIRLHTPGKPPTYLAIAIGALLIIGFIFNYRTLKSNK